MKNVLKSSQNEKIKLATGSAMNMIIVLLLNIMICWSISAMEIEGREEVKPIGEQLKNVVSEAFMNGSDQCLKDFLDQHKRGIRLTKAEYFNLSCYVGKAMSNRRTTLEIMPIALPEHLPAYYNRYISEYNAVAKSVAYYLTESNKIKIKN